MNSSKYRFTLDMHSSQSQVSLPIVLNDTARKLYISFSDGGNDFVFNPGMFCLFRKLFGEEAVYPPLKLAVLRLNVTSVKELLWFDTVCRVACGL